MKGKDNSTYSGRVTLFVLILAYFASILIAGFFVGYGNFWQRYLKVSTSQPSFLDTHHLTSALECSRKGYDVLRENPCEQNKLPMDYPRIWLQLARFGIDQSDSKFIGFGFATLFFAAVFLFVGRINFFEGFIYATVICSPSIMLGIETGNTDLLIFVLLASAILLIRASPVCRILAYSLLSFTAILKLYPIAAAITCFREGKKTAMAVFTAVFLLFIIYAACTLPDIVKIHKNASTSTYLSYGVNVFFDMLYDIFKSAGRRVPHRHLNLYLVLSVLTISGAAYVLGGIKKANGLRVDFLDSFRIGGSIYVMTFLLWNNWDYRLMFLVFTLPQILLWIKQREQLSAISLAALLVLVSTLWISSKSPMNWNFSVVNHFLADEILNWFLFFFFSYTLLLTLPEWLKEQLFPLHNVELDYAGNVFSDTLIED